MYRFSIPGYLGYIFIFLICAHFARSRKKRETKGEQEITIAADEDASLCWGGLGFQVAPRWSWIGQELELQAVLFLRFVVD